MDTAIHSLRFSNLELNNIGRFSNLLVDFKDGINVICGSNGVGKTTVLDALAATVVTHNGDAYIRRRANFEGSGSIAADLETPEESRRIKGSIQTIDPEKRFDGFGMRSAAPHLIYVRPNRDFGYVRKNVISRDIDIQEYSQQNRSYAGVSTTEIKDWFTNRFLLRPHGDNWPLHRKQNLESAINLFGQLDASVSLHGVDTSTYDIEVSTSAGIIPFEYLSSGFRSCFAMLIGIIKEIEYRKLNVSAKQFSGVILVDEIDLHLHPTWQSKILSVFRDQFPCAQIIVTTHSPHVVQSARSDEVIALVLQPDGEPLAVYYKDSKYGFVGWSIEEILVDVMGVEDTTTAVYRNTVSDFERCLDTDDAAGASEAYHELMIMLHPNSPLRKVFTLQASSLLDTSMVADRLKRLRRD